MQLINNVCAFFAVMIFKRFVCEHIVSNSCQKAVLKVYDIKGSS